MKLAVFYHHAQEAARQKGMTLQAVLREIRLMGIRGLDCSLEEVRQPGFFKSIRDEGLEVASIYAFFDFGRQSDPDRVKLLLETAVDAGCRRVMVIPGFIRDTADQESPEWDRQVGLMVKELATVCREAEKTGIQVTMEDFDDVAAPFATSAQLLRFFSAIPGLRCAFDTGNFRYSGEDEVDAFNRLENLVVHVHCKDRSLSGQEGEEGKLAPDGTLLHSSPVGSGFIRMAEIVDRLLANGYQGYFAIEHFGSPDYLEYMKSSARWLQARVPR